MQLHAFTSPTMAMSVSNWAPLKKATSQSKKMSSMGDIFADSQYMDSV
jgi:hypothetical protein